MPGRRWVRNSCRSPGGCGRCFSEICAGTWAGAGLITAADGAQASAALGAVLALYGVLGLTAVEFPVPGRFEPWLSPVIGVATGIVTAATGVYMIPSAPYLQAIGLEKDRLRSEERRVGKE